MKFEDIEPLLQKDRFYFASPCGLGDTYFLCALKNALENKLNGKIVFIIQESHIPVLELFDDTDFIAVENDNFRGNADILKTFSFCKITPTLGKVYPAHPMCVNQKEVFKKNFLYSYIIFFGLPTHCKILTPNNIPKLDSKLQSQIEKIAPLHKLCLYVPESQTLDSLTQTFIQSDIEDLRAHGFEVIINTFKKTYILNNAHFLNLNLKELLALGANVGMVYCTRSGFSDVIAIYAKKLRVYYPTHGALRFYSLKINKLSINATEIPLQQEGTIHLAYRIGSLLLAYQRKDISFFKLLFCMFQAYKHTPLNTQYIDAIYPIDLVESAPYKLGLAFIENNGNLTRFGILAFVLRFCATKNHKFFTRKYQNESHKPSNI
ncbi:hypothetical protein CQA49_06375 [Helicobacter sp. MIT 00-7814]|uniref:hypothetical protein n=1 Tax=unclassified Helicobacter TaxID=2593540 RepID=UPI000E1E36F2|nr:MULTISPECIES: hypothetical protein [unclassified Helicobacter]RDU53543.1 hypothetical protein CQA49_06375 [Helicobacter sp. MIT 00-7814]RDU57031.1 hypothetical protein CQA37_01090 [Helicobacter sp. MIT 99-10781]